MKTSQGAAYYGGGTILFVLVFGVLLPWAIQLILNAIGG